MRQAALRRSRGELQSSIWPKLGHVTWFGEGRETHRDLKVEQCGMIVDKQHPWINATPDFLVSCSCCGNGCGEVKCPYNIENCDLESYVEKKNSCLEKVNGKVQLKRNHQYFFQVQQQLFITDSQYCDFVGALLTITIKQGFSWREFTRTFHTGNQFF